MLIPLPLCRMSHTGRLAKLLSQAESWKTLSSRTDILTPPPVPAWDAVALSSFGARTAIYGQGEDPDKYLLLPSLCLTMSLSPFVFQPSERSMKNISIRHLREHLAHRAF